jgi:hypothetical protein
MKQYVRRSRSRDKRSRSEGEKSHKGDRDITRNTRTWNKTCSKTVFTHDTEIAAIVIMSN